MDKAFMGMNPNNSSVMQGDVLIEKRSSISKRCWAIFFWKNLLFPSSDLNLPIRVFNLIKELGGEKLINKKRHLSSIESTNSLILLSQLQLGSEKFVLETQIRQNKQITMDSGEK